MRLVFLDTGTLGMVANPRGTPRAVQCQQWARDLLAAGVRVFVPEICDYEERRKLIHAGSTSGLARLDRLKIGFDYAPITTDVMLKAAELSYVWGEEAGAGWSCAQKPLFFQAFRLERGLANPKSVVTTLV
ncbi:MAG: hypothetical protein ACLQGP_09420, partial [Isosphaeraceae bacterium]